MDIDPDNMRRTQLANEQLAPVIKALEEGKPLPASSAPGLHKTFIQNGLLCREFQSSSSSTTAKTQQVILKQLHDNAGHLGLWKKTESIKEQFYWPAYELDIQKWVQGCQKCHQRNAPQLKLQAPLGTIKATQPFEKISWDIMGPLPTSSQGKKYILVVTDIFSK